MYERTAYKNKSLRKFLFANFFKIEIKNRDSLFIPLNKKNLLFLLIREGLCLRNAKLSRIFVIASAPNRPGGA